MIALTPVEPFEIEPDDDARLQGIAESFSAGDDRFAADRENYAEQFSDRLPGRNVLTLHVDDFSIISNLKDIPAIEGYPARAFVRIRDGDLVAGTFPPIAGYADYLDGHLGLGRSTYIRASPAPGALAYAGFAALLADDDAQSEILRGLGDRHRDLWIHPYMGLETAWRFARRMAERSGRRVRVLGPLPTITERANNKVWFTELVRAVLGEASILESSTTRSVDEICEYLRHVANRAADQGSGGDGRLRSSRVALKLSDSASGMGTRIIESSEIRERSPESLQAFVVEWLAENEWTTKSPPVAVERWEGASLGSPSIQLWIPPLTDPDTGLGGREASTPLLEGVFDQLFYPQNETIFLGGLPSRLPELLRRRVGEAGVRLARVLQYLGYVGRCSFDTILVGESLADAAIVFTECNGRWGGTSTPMSLMNRLFGDYRQKPYFCRNFSHRGLEGVPFDELLPAVDAVLFDVRSGEGWAILFNLGCLEPAGKLDLITLGETFELAERRQAEFREVVEHAF